MTNVRVVKYLTKGEKAREMKLKQDPGRLEVRAARMQLTAKWQSVK